MSDPIPTAARDPQKIALEDWTLTGLRVGALIDAMDQILDDMGKANLCVSPLAKAKARVAFEPFMHPDCAEYFMSLEEAARIVKDCEDAR